MTDLEGQNYENDTKYAKCSECGQEQLSFALGEDGRCYYCNGMILPPEEEPEEEKV